MEDNNLLPQNALQLSSSTVLAHTQPVLKAKSCIACRKRKVKCDRDVPCSNCARWCIDCIYPSPIRTCARPRKRPTSQARATQLFPSFDDRLYSTRISALESRIAQLTAALNTQSSQLQTAAQPPSQIHPTRHTWAQAVIQILPPAETAHACWQVFLETVDPLVKVLYRPHAYRVLQRVTQAPHAARDGEHALVLAVYLACISAMAERDVQTHFRMAKATGIAAFRAATERALVQARFTATDDMTTIQALVLFISFSIYHREQKSAWTLAGLARRLDLAPEKGRSLFDTEMRRRLWWQLWYLDRRATEDYRGKESGSSDADADPAQSRMALPLNCCDSALHPNMTWLPVTPPAWTEMSFSLVRFDIAYTRRFIESDQPWLSKVTAVQDCQRRLQTRFLAHCDGTQPIHWLAQHVAYVLTTEIWMDLYNDSSGVPDTPTSADRLIYDRLFIAAIDILDIPVRLEKEPEARQWEWLLGAYFQYTPLTFLLKELVRRYDDPLAEAAWHIAQRAFQRWPQDVRESAHGAVLTELMTTVRNMRSQLGHGHIPFREDSAFFGLGLDCMDGEGMLSGISAAEDMLLPMGQHERIYDAEEIS